MKNYFHTVDTEWFNQRLVGVLIVVLLLFGALIVRLLYLQVIEGEELRRLSEINSIRLQDIHAPRGLVHDRGGRTIVDNRPSFDLHIVLKDAKPLAQTLERLGQLLDEPLDQIMQRLEAGRPRGPYSPILLKADIGRDTLAAIEVNKFALPGVVVQVSPRRHYMGGQFAAHILGYMGEISPDELRRSSLEGLKRGDFIGKVGLERAHESFLRGKRGGRQVEVNATGQVIRVLQTVDALPGHDVYLTLDHDLQLKTEALLDGRAGAAVALDPSNGKILAIASSPSFDPNLFVSGMTREQWQDLTTNHYRPLENKVIQGEYPPASVYKIVPLVAALEEGIVDAQTTFFCSGSHQFGNRAYRCWKRGGHGHVNAVKALTESCDVYFYQVGNALGVDRLAHWANKVGLGRPTGFDIDREGRGLVPTAQWKLNRFGEPWQRGETLSVVIGQSFNLTTPLQLAVMTAAVGNGGFRYKPYLVETIQTADGEVVFQTAPEVVGQFELRDTTWGLLKQGLWKVVNDPTGTAFRSRIRGLEYSGKTGTAQVVARPKDNEERPEVREERHRNHGLFVAYAPSINPRIAVAVVIEHGESGSGAAAPVAREMIRTYLGSDWIAADVSTP
jgi:penicillin-binding protein 2